MLGVSDLFIELMPPDHPAEGRMMRKRSLKVGMKVRYKKSGRYLGVVTAIGVAAFSYMHPDGYAGVAIPAEVEISDDEEA